MELYDGHDHQLGHVLLLDGSRVIAEFKDATDDEKAALAASTKMADALMAIRARLRGEFDAPELAAFGPLGDANEDIIEMVNRALPWA